MPEQQSLFDERQQQLMHLQNYQVNKISHSKIATYQNCPFNYYLTYVRRVAVPKAIHFAFGEAIHHKFDEFYDKHFKSAQAFANIWSRYWTGIMAGSFLPEEDKANLIVTEYERVSRINGKVHTIRIGNDIRLYGSNPINQFFNYLSKGKRLLKDFANENMHKAPPILREKKFELSFIGATGKTYPLTGVVDRIDRTERGLILSDYKTDRNTPFQRELDSKNQFTIYYLGFRTLLDILLAENRPLATKYPELLTQRYPDEMYYHHLVSGKVFRINIGDEQIKNLETTLEHFTAGINSRDFDPKSSRVCGGCDYSFNGVCQQYLQEYIELKRELNQPRAIIPEGQQWGTLLTDQPAEAVPVKKKPAAYRRKVQGETEDQHALWPSRKRKNKTIES